MTDQMHPSYPSEGQEEDHSTHEETTMPINGFSDDSYSLDDSKKGNVMLRSRALGQYNSNQNKQR